MEQVLAGLENVSIYLDDVLVAGVDLDDCHKKLYTVLDRLNKANIKVNWKKCSFFVSNLPYLGHIITDKGLLPSPDKISTISKAATPKNVTELKAFLGLINYYGKFVPHLSSKLFCINYLKKT